MGLKRRSLLKATGMTLAAWATGGVKWGAWADRYAATLAAPARHKYALLVGINQYAGDSADCPELRGCLQDVALQRQLLIHRFGFLPENIVVLQDKQATRSRVQSVWLEHLLNQVTAEDTVFFHFSGYGSTIQVTPEGPVQRSLVLYDSCLEDKNSGIRDWPEATLLALLRALPTDQVISVLDTSYTLPEGYGLTEAVRLRSRPSPPPGPLDAQTTDLQEKLRGQLQGRGVLVKPSASAGLILRATDWGELALEFDSPAGPLGLMTYALTQQLWHTAAEANWSRVWVNAQERLPNLLRRAALVQSSIPVLSLAQSGLVPMQPSGGAGVVTAVRKDKTVELWLGGLSTEALAYGGEGAIVRLRSLTPGANATTSATENTTEQYLQIQSRTGLGAEARLYRPPTTGLASAAEAGVSISPPSPQRGQLIQEQVRLLPRQVELAVAVDQHLNRIERVDATSALSSLSKVSVVALGSAPADYLFGRVSPHLPTLVAALPQELRPPGTGLEDSPQPELPGIQYGLLTLGHSPLPPTVGAPSEAIKTAIQHLQPHVQSLRAAKNFRLLQNEYSSRLAVRSHWQVLSPNNQAKSATAAATAETQPSPRRDRLSAHPAVPSPWMTLAPQDRLRYQIKNESDRPVYLIILSFSNRANWHSLAIRNLTTPLVPAAEAQDSVALPQGQSVVELYSLVSTAPFSQTQKFLMGASAANPPERGQQIAMPFALSEAILQDLQQASLAHQIAPTSNSDFYTLDLSTWAAFHQTCQITNL